ncbi:MAG TPA: glutamate synthase subunit beta [Patescibacteria group bacterium]|nr:glutamate synthase subunit beta [Patescibacteria group bacterium]
MRRPRGFIEIERAPSASRPQMDRIGDWRETHLPHPEATLRDQGARCMDCGTPFCHTGVLVSGLAMGCPVNNLIPEWNDLVSRGHWEEAYRRLAQTNDLPEVTGRVCPAPCEGSCTVGIGGSPVTIKALEAAIIDRAWDEGWIRPEPPAVRTGRRVAIVGSGPAGLACAAQLNRRGHAVTVYERADRVGGLLMYGIPAMKLEKAVLERRIDLMRAAGVVFETGVEVGRGLDPGELVAGTDAVVLCTGATVARDLAIPGRELPGINLAMTYLEGATRALLDGTPQEAEISAAGRDAVIIGGGDTGTDCVATAVRQGARSLVQLEILARPPDERAPDNPWPQWPRVYRLDYGQEEAAARWGGDPRRYAVATRRFVPGSGGAVAGIEIVDVDWAPGPEGRLAPVEQAGTERTLPADLVLLALGFSGPERSLPDQLGCALDGRGTILVDEAHETSVPGVFAAGDCRRGQSLVVWAIREGRRAAHGVDEHLSAAAHRQARTA